MTNLGQLKCSPIPVRMGDGELKAARTTPHEFASLADTLSGISGMALGRALTICYRCGEDRLMKTSQHYDETLR